MDQFSSEETASQLRARIAELENTAKIQALEIQELKKKVQQKTEGYVANPSTPFPLLSATHQDLKKVFEKINITEYTRLFRANRDVYQLMEGMHPSFHRKIEKDIEIAVCAFMGRGTWRIGRIPYLPGKHLKDSSNMDDRFKEDFCNRRHSFHFRSIIFTDKDDAWRLLDNTQEYIDTGRRVANCFGDCNITCDQLNTNRVPALQEMFDNLKPKVYRASGYMAGQPFFQNLEVKGVKRVSLSRCLSRDDIFAALDEQVFADCHELYVELETYSAEEILKRICDFMKRLQATKRSKILRGAGFAMEELNLADSFRNSVNLSTPEADGLIWMWWFFLPAEPGAVVTWISTPRIQPTSLIHLTCRYCGSWDEFVQHFGRYAGGKEEQIRQMFFN